MDDHMFGWNNEHGKKLSFSNFHEHLYGWIIIITNWKDTFYATI